MIERLIVFVFCILSAYGLPPCREVVYDYYTLAMTWPNEYCSEHYCVRDWNRAWDGKSLITHGFWPSSTDLAYLTCLQEHDNDPYCDEPFTYNDNLFTDKEILEMRKYWPKLSNPKNFWSYEWLRHGTCYMDIIYNQYKSNLSRQQIFKSYYLETVKKVKDSKFALKRGKIMTKQQLARQLGINANNFYAYCGKDDQLDEIRVCYSVTAKPGAQKLTKCPFNKDYNQCPFPMIVK